MPATQKPKATYYYKLFRVKRNTGKVTTVSLCPILVTQACKTMEGGLKEVGQLVRKAAFNYEEGMYKNCSGYVREQLKEAVAKAMAERKNKQRAAAINVKTVAANSGMALAAA